MSLAPGMQTTRINQPMRIGTCQEANCEWFLVGAEGMDEGMPFSHPAGVRCGDFQRCTHPNCPCPQRQPHMVVDDRFGARFFANTGLGEHQVVLDEYVTRVYEGVDAIQIIRTRGL